MKVAILAISKLSAAQKTQKFISKNQNCQLYYKIALSTQVNSQLVCIYHNKPLLTTACNKTH